VVAGVVALTIVGGIAVAQTTGGTGAKACLGGGGLLRLTKANGKCATGETVTRLDAPASSATRINFSQATPEASSVSHYLATSGPVSLLASCQGTAGSTTTLVLSITGGAAVVGYTASESVSDTVSGVTGPASVTVVHGATAALQTKSFDTETTTGNRSDLITLEASGPDGSQITGTIDAELTTGSGPACSVGGSLVAA